MELEQFKTEAKRHGICDMLNDWENAKSKKQLMDLALSIRGIEYIARSIFEGWGLDADYISKEFGQFCNGGYVRQGEGYSTILYCQYPNDIHINETAALIIDCHGLIRVDRSISELYIVNSNVTVNGRAFVYSYNSDVKGSQSIIKEDYRHGV